MAIIMKYYIQSVISVITFYFNHNLFVKALMYVPIVLFSIVSFPFQVYALVWYIKNCDEHFFFPEEIDENAYF